MGVFFVTEVPFPLLPFSLARPNSFATERILVCLASPSSAYPSLHNKTCSRVCSSVAERLLGVFASLFSSILKGGAAITDEACQDTYLKLKIIATHCRLAFLELSKHIPKSAAQP